MEKKVFHFAKSLKMFFTKSTKVEVSENTIGQSQRTKAKINLYSFAQKTKKYEQVLDVNKNQ